MPRGKGGRGKKTPTPTVGVYNPNTVSLYRKVSDHSAKIDDYREKVMEHNEAIGEDRPDAAEISDVDGHDQHGRGGLFTGNPKVTPGDFSLPTL